MHHTFRNMMFSDKNAISWRQAIKNMWCLHSNSFINYSLRKMCDASYVWNRIWISGKYVGHTAGIWYFCRMNPWILWTLDCSKRCLKCLAVSWEPTRYWMYRDIEYGRSACGANWEFQTPKNCFCCLLHCVRSGWYCSNKIKPQLLCFCEGFRVWKIIILSHVGTVTTSAVPLFLFPTTNLYMWTYTIEWLEVLLPFSGM